ncbi:MAG: ArsR/SmtB family transcription factor [Acidimicrobiales bacterium]
MPLIAEDGTDRRGPRTLVAGSIAVELDWAFGLPSRPAAMRDHPSLERAYAASPGLARRIESFWGPEEATAWGSSIELQILAHHAGVLFSLDPKELIGQLEAICADAPTDPRLASEPAPDRAALLARLRRLRSSAPLRRRYVKLVSDLWSALEPHWEREGRAAVEASVAWRTKVAEKGVPWRDVAGKKMPECCAEGQGEKDAKIRQLESWLGPDEAVAIVPSFFASGGSFVDLPGLLLIGQRAGGDTDGPGARARMEPLARRLKALSDPTRLAMLEALAATPLGVNELAQRFAVAQPTASNHLKLLREAGIVSNGAGSDRHKLVVDARAVSELLGGLGKTVLPDQ